MDAPTAYEIVLQGPVADRRLAPLLDDFVVDRPQPGRTRLVGIVRDAAHLHGVLVHLTSVAAEVVSVNALSTGDQ